MSVWLKVSPSIHFRTVCLEVITPTWPQNLDQSNSATCNEDLWFIVFTVIKVHVHNTGFYNTIKDRWLVTVLCEMYLFSCISKALFEQVFSDADTDKDADIYTHRWTHTLSSQSVILSRNSSCKVWPVAALLMIGGASVHLYGFFLPTVISPLSRATRTHYWRSGFDLWSSGRWNWTSVTFQGSAGKCKHRHRPPS